MIKKGLTSLVVFFLYLISLLPFAVLYAFSDVIYIITYYVLGYRRKVVAENLINSFPQKTNDERKAIEKKYYRFLADIMVETIKLMTISEAEITKRMIFPNVEVLEDYFSKGRSLLVAVGHYGNWELSAQRTGLLTDKVRIVVYKPLSNPAANDIFNKVRGKFGSTLVSMKGILRKLIELRDVRSLTVLASDQTPVKEEVQYFTRFLNQPTAVFLGIEKIAVMLNSVVIFGDVRVIKRGYYSCTFVPLFENPKDTKPHEITDAHVHYLENMINKEPQYWLWSHRRWKFKPTKS